MSRKEWPRAVYQEVLYGVQEVARFVTQLELDELTAEKDLRHELGVDMLSILEIVVMCEDRFNVVLSEENVRMIHTIDDIVQCVLDLQVEAA